MNDRHGIDELGHAEGRRLREAATAIADVDDVLHAVRSDGVEQARPDRLPDRRVVALVAAAACTLLVSAMVVRWIAADDSDQITSAPQAPTTGDPSVSAVPTPPATEQTSRTTEATGAPTTTGTPSTSSVPSTTAPAPSTTVLHDFGGPLGLWPANAAIVPLASLPRLLPSIEVPGADAAFRGEGAEPSAQPLTYSQAWFEPASSAALTITTFLDAVPLPSTTAEPVDVPGWAHAEVSRAGPYQNLTLVSDRGYVRVAAHGLSSDELVAIGASMRRAPPADWLLPGEGRSWIEITQGGVALPTSNRFIIWSGAGSLVAKLTISSGPLHEGPVMSGGVTFETVDVDGHRATLITLPGAWASVLWQPEPGITIQFTIQGDRDTALRLARSLETVGDDEWVAASSPYDRDGCNDFFC